MQVYLCSFTHTHTDTHSETHSHTHWLGIWIIGGRIFFFKGVKLKLINWFLIQKSWCLKGRDFNIESEYFLRRKAENDTEQESRIDKNPWKERKWFSGFYLLNKWNTPFRCCKQPDSGCIFTTSLKHLIHPPRHFHLLRVIRRKGTLIIKKL